MDIEFIEDDETIRLIVHRPGRTETFHLDADDSRWTLTFDDDGTIHLLTSTNGDFQ